MLRNDALIELRVRLDDEAYPFLWSDKALLGYLNAAENEACERALLIEEDAPVDLKTATGATQTSGVATVAATAHGFDPGVRLRFAGADQAAYNVELVPTVVDANTLQFPVDAGTATPATGTITVQSASAAITNLLGLANKPQYTLDTRIIEVRTVLWDNKFMHGISRDALSSFRCSDGDAVHHRYPYPYSWCCRYFRPFLNADWSTLTGNPCFFIDPQEKYLRLVRIPTTDAPIHLSVYRRPLTPLVGTFDVDGMLARDDDGTLTGSDTQTFEIAESHHIHLLEWAEHLAYNKRDSDAHDPKLAQQKDDAFTARFGLRVDANIRRQQRSRQSNHTVMNPDW